MPQDINQKFLNHSQIMEIRDERIKKKLSEISELQDEQREKYFSWLKNIITLAVGFFGILISLKSDKAESQIQHIFFIIAMSSLAYGILSGVLVLYSEIHVINKVKKHKGKNILKMLDDEKIDFFEYIGPNKIFKCIEWTCFIGFTIAIISLVIYSSLY